MDLENSFYKCWAEIDLGAMTDNVRIVRGLAGPDRLLMVCLKARGYGHGLVPLAKAALSGGADRICVADVHEGISLRKAGIECPIQVLLEPSPSSAGALYHYNLIPTLSSHKIVREMADLLPGKLAIHVEVDTGMNRVGLNPGNVVSFLEFIRSTGKFTIEGMFSHFSSSHVANDPQCRALTLKQLQTFLQAVDNCRAAGHDPELIHVASSGAVMNYPEAFLDMIRVGFLIHGIPRDWITRPFKPVLTWKCRVQSLVTITAGQGIGYEGSHITSTDTTLAAIACGYSDGYPHQLSGRSHVLIRGCRAPVVGKVGMNLTMVDAGHIPGIEIGDEVVLIGVQGQESITATELAFHLGTPPAVVTSGISMKVPRIYLSGEPEKRKE